MVGRIITVAQQKGGSGKTTIAAHLAVGFAVRGNRVALLDVDPQGSLGQWFEAREQHVERPGLAFRTASGWGARREARSLADDYDVVVVDTPPKSDSESRPAIEAASIVLVPIQPTPVDLWATDPTLQAIARERVLSMLIVNRVVARAALSAEMTAAIQGLGHLVATTRIGNRVAFPASMGKGSTVLETIPVGPASLEVTALTAEVAEVLNR